MDIHKHSPQKFISKEVISGFLLIACAILALIANNSPLAPLYRQFLEIPVGFAFQGVGIVKPLLLWVNDGLMAIFFFLVGLEIKREVVGPKRTSCL